MNRIIYLLFGLLVILFSYGCSSVTVNVDLRDCPYPVMCSPIMRIGDSAPPENNLVVFDEFSARAEKSYSGHYWDSTSTSYGSEYKTITHTHSESTFYGRSDNIAVEIQKATAGRSDLVIVVDEVRNECFQHNSIFGFFIDRFCVEGKTVLPESLKK